MITRKLNLRSKNGMLNEIIIIGDTQDNALRYAMLLEFNYIALGYRSVDPELFHSNNSKAKLCVCVSHNTYFRQFSDLSYLVFFVADDYNLVGQLENEFNQTMQVLGFNILDETNETNETTIESIDEDINF